MVKQRIDLNLFRVFEAVMQHRSVNGASRELKVTPSAVSHALSRLRQELADDLFVPGDNGMEPTARALEIMPGIRSGLSSIDNAVGIKPFVPSEAVRTFRIVATEYTTVTILTPLIARMAAVAPHIRLRVFPGSRVDVVRHLDDGRVDLVIGWFDEVPVRLHRTLIRLEREALIVRPGHPLTQGTITKERLLGFPYVVVELTGSEDAPTDGFMDERNLRRRVWVERLLLDEVGDSDEIIRRMTVGVPYYAAVPSLLLRTDMVATLPLSLARPLAKYGMVEILALPYEPPDVKVEAVWHQRSEKDAGAQWLIGEMLDVVREAADAPPTVLDE
jgi:DNA-binding transcriptional LysR family regulator